MHIRPQGEPTYGYMKCYACDKLFLSFFLIIDESTTSTMKQHLIVYCCYLSLKGKGVATVSFLANQFYS